MNNCNEMKLLAIAGEGEAERAARLLYGFLETAPEVSPCLLTPGGASLVPLLEEARSAGCTHGVIWLDGRAVSARSWVDVPLYAAAPAGERNEGNASLLEESGRWILDLDERGWEGYNRKVNRPVFTYSERKDIADLTAKHTRLVGRAVEFEAVAAGSIGRVRLDAESGFGVYDVLCAMACGLSLGLKPGDMVRAVNRLRPFRSVR